MADLPSFLIQNKDKPSGGSRKPAVSGRACAFEGFEIERTREAAESGDQMRGRLGDRCREAAPQAEGGTFAARSLGRTLLTGSKPLKASVVRASLPNARFCGADLR